jgi:hypothetical protein
VKFTTFKPRASLRVHAYRDGDYFQVLPPGVKPEHYVPAVDDLERIPAVEFNKLFTPERKAINAKRKQK